MNLLAYQFLEAIQTAFNNATNSSTILPGGLWYGRAPDATISPYGLVTIEDGKKTFTTNGYFLQNLTMKIVIYSTEGIASTSIKNIAVLLSEAFDFKNADMNIANGKVVNIQPMGNLVDIDSQLRESEDVVVSTFNWLIILSGGELL